MSIDIFSRTDFQEPFVRSEKDSRPRRIARAPRVLANAATNTARLGESGYGQPFGSVSVDCGWLAYGQSVG